MTVAPSPYDIIRAIQDQQRATERLVQMLVGMLDASAPDPFTTAVPPAPDVIPIPPPVKRHTGESARPPVFFLLHGQQIKTTERRVNLLRAAQGEPLTMSEMTRRGVASTVDAVKQQIIDTNKDLERAGVALRIQPLPRMLKPGARGGREAARYSLLRWPPAPEIATPCHFPAAQNEAAAGARPEQGSAASAEGDGDDRVTAHVVQFVTPTDAGEGVSPPADPAPAADEQDLSDRASRMVGGFPGAAAPSHAEVTGGCGDVETIAVEDAVDHQGVTGGESAARDAQRPSNRDVSADDEPSSGAGPQAEAPHAGTGSEPLAGHESRSESDPALNAGRGVRVVPPSPVIKSKAAQKPKARLPIEPGDLIAVDVKFRLIQTTKGLYEVAGANLARALERLRGGQMFGLDVIARAAGWPTAEVARTALGFERKRLGDHGIDLYLDKINVRLRSAS